MAILSSADHSDSRESLIKCSTGKICCTLLVSLQFRLLLWHTHACTSSWFRCDPSICASAEAVYCVRTQLQAQPHMVPTLCLIRLRKRVLGPLPMLPAPCLLKALHLTGELPANKDACTQHARVLRLLSQWCIASVRAKAALLVKLPCRSFCVI